MKTDLSLQRVIAVDPARWQARLEIIAEHSLAKKASDGFFQTDEDDDDDDGPMLDYLGDPLPVMRMDGDVAIIPLKGIVYAGCPSLYLRYGFCDLNQVAADIKAAMADDNCQAIVLDVDSPGGVIRGVPEFGSMLAAFVASGNKPIAARATMACSAAYWAIAPCTLISCPPSADMVNVGVYQVNVNTKKAFEAFGYTVQVFKSGKFKAAGVPGTDLSDDQAKEIQDSVDEWGAAFRAFVSASRPAATEANLQGQVFSGAKACALGFADDDSDTDDTFMLRFRAYLQTSSAS